jgi:IS605 OrfB family transposase
MDVNEDNVAPTAFSENGVEDTLVIDFPEIKFERHRYFTMRKRVQNAEKNSIHDTLEGREERFARDRLHRVSRHIVEWSRQFETPCIVFEDLTEMRDSIDYGTRMNRCLHQLLFRAFQFYTSYKASFEGIPTAWIDPAYTSQRCPMCGHTERGNRNKKRFKCRSCGHQAHSDRGASQHRRERHREASELDCVCSQQSSAGSEGATAGIGGPWTPRPFGETLPMVGWECPSNPREASGL